MNKLIKTFVNAFLLLALPSMPLYPENSIPRISLQKELAQEFCPSYDEILQLLAEIESGEFEKKYTSEADLEKIANFLVILAREGSLGKDSVALEEDIEELLNDEDTIFFGTPTGYEARIIPGAFYGDGEIILCKSWIKKQWKHVKKFVKKNKKALIIGAAIIATTAVIVFISAEVAAGAAGGAAAAAKGNESSKKDSSSKAKAFNEELSSIKDTIIEEGFFEEIPHPDEGLPWEESGRAVGSILAHDKCHTLNKEGDGIAAHSVVDRKFSTDYSHFYKGPGETAGSLALAYQARGERALELGYYTQAIEDLGKVIENNPSNPFPYLERGIAHFSLGNYDRSLEDYNHFAARNQTTNKASDFSLGFAKGFPKGVYESGEGLMLFAANLLTHPVQTSTQLMDSVAMLAELARKDEWKEIGQALSPQLHQLATEWDTLTPEKQGELMGYALGKHGADIFIPGAVAKVAAKSVKGAKELAGACKNIQRAQETLILETAAEVGSAAKLAEVIEVGQKTVLIAEELGIPSNQIGALKQSGKLEATIAKNYDHLTPAMRESFLFYKKAEAKLERYTNQPLPEIKVRELIQETGVQTFLRPKGIPEDFLVMVSDKGAGIKYVDPINNSNSIRVMPGKPHSPELSQQKPYIIQQKNGNRVDKYGNFVAKQSTEAHIPLNEFIYRN